MADEMEENEDLRLARSLNPDIMRVMSAQVYTTIDREARSCGVHPEEARRAFLEKTSLSDDGAFFPIAHVTYLALLVEWANDHNMHDGDEVAVPTDERLVGRSILAAFSVHLRALDRLKDEGIDIDSDEMTEEKYAEAVKATPFILPA